MPLPPRLVIFDCDGVLVDSEHIANEVMAAHITAVGWPMTPDESRRRFVGNTMAKVIADIEAHTGSKLAADWLAVFETARDQAFVGRLKPVAGIEQVLDGLERAGVPFCVASSGSPAKMNHCLTLTGLLPRLQGRLYSTQQVARGKPHPDIFLHAAAAMGHAPADCVVIEDTPVGATAARAAGMRCLAYVPEGESAGFVELNAEPFSAMAQLLGRLGLA